MRLAKKALVAALTMLVLCAAVSAQTLRNENDPRNQSPSVGIGVFMACTRGLYRSRNVGAHSNFDHSLSFPVVATGGAR
jgi:hypothetical protein